MCCIAIVLSPHLAPSNFNVHRCTMNKFKDNRSATIALSYCTELLQWKITDYIALRYLKKINIAFQYSSRSQEISSDLMQLWIKADSSTGKHSNGVWYTPV